MGSLNVSAACVLVCFIVRCVFGDVCKDTPHPEIPSVAMKSCIINSPQDLATVPDATTIELQFTQLNTLDFTQFHLEAPSLTYLVFHLTYLSYTKLRRAMNGLKAPNLQTVTVKRDLDRDGASFYLDGETFMNIASMQTLNLNNVGIGTVDVKAFKGLYSLKLLDLSENYLVEVPENALQDCHNLTTLLLKDNFITPSKLHENSFTGPTALNWLNLENNDITFLPGRCFINSTSLSNLVLTHNNLMFMDEEALLGLGNLHYLSLSDNKLGNVPREALKAIPKVFSLDLSYNELNDLSPNDFEGLISLEILYLQYTNLGDVSGDCFQGLKKLREIHLKGNAIQTVNASTFEHLPQLMHIDLSDNKLKQIAVDTFTSLPNLEVLDLDQNELKYLEEGIFDGLKMLEELYLRENRWNCSCSLLWLFQWIHDNEDSLINEHELYTISCSTPQEYSHYKFFDLRYSFVMGCQEDLTGLDLTTESQQKHVHNGLSTQQLAGLIAGIVIFVILLVAIILIMVFMHRRKQRKWKPTQQQRDLEERRDRTRYSTPSWCKDPSPAPELPPRSIPPQNINIHKDVVTPEMENKMNDGFAFDNEALETSMMSKNGLSPTKSNGSPMGVEYGPLSTSPRDQIHPSDVQNHVDINKNSTS